jgi:hypothetical protein
VIASERARVAHDRARLLEDLAAQGGSLVDEPDVEPQLRRLVGGGEPRGPAADDEKVVRQCGR